MIMVMVMVMVMAVWVECEYYSTYTIMIVRYNITLRYNLRPYLLVNACAHGVGATYKKKSMNAETFV